jgi:anti-sigma factor RsiW
MTCSPENVTAFVDGELPPTEAAAVAAHLEGCPTCRAQAEEERQLRRRLSSLPVPVPPPHLDQVVRGRLRRQPAITALRLGLPLAAMLLAGLALRSWPAFVAFDLARDHDKCFSRHPVPAEVWSTEPEAVVDWFGRQGTRLPRDLPSGAGGLSLVGARYCPLVSLSMAPHVYYAAGDRHVSVFVVTHAVRLRGRYAGEMRGDAVRLLRVDGTLVGIVGEHEADVQAFEAALGPALVARDSAAPALR